MIAPGYLKNDLCYVNKIFRINSPCIALEAKPKIFRVSWIVLELVTVALWTAVYMSDNCLAKMLYWHNANIIGLTPRQSC